MSAVIKDVPAYNCFWGHRWTKWTDKEPVQILDGGKVKAQGFQQERRCAVCNQAELRLAKINIWDAV